MTRLDAAGFERATSWNPKIAETLLGDGFRDEGKERCWGSLHVCRQTGLWYDFASTEHGISSVKLIQFLKKRAGEEFHSSDAERWLVKFLSENPGAGPLEAEGEWTQTHQTAAAELARHALDTAAPLAADSHGAAYLTSRGLPGPYPETLRWLPNARPGEGALVMPLTANGRITGIQLTYIDGLGAKSLVEPVRRRLDLEQAPGAVMEIAAAEPGVTNLVADTIAAEGLENSLSTALARTPGQRVLGLPGIYALKNLGLARGERITVFQDSDPDGHPARAGLQAGLDALILAGAIVRLTPWTPDGDANAISQAKGVTEISRLLAAAEPVKLSAEADVNSTIAKLAARPRGEWEKERQKLHERTKWRLGTLDREYELARKRVVPEPGADDPSAEGLLSVPEDPPWSGPIPSLLPILDTIRKHFRRFAAITGEQLTAVVLWVAAAHLIHSTNLDIDLFPKLAIESKDPASGKTTLLTLIWNCLPRAKLWTYPTGAYLVRALEQARFSLCLDELQYAEDRNLLRVINASQHRTMAYVPLLVPDHKGAYIPHEYLVWAPMALARLGEFSTAQQSRSIVIWMLPKLPGDKKEHLRRPIVPELADCRRQLTAWADSLTDWVDPTLPTSLNNRDVDNWIPLLFAAQQAGGQWPGLAAKAVEELMKAERRPTLTVRLLRSIWTIFQPDPDGEAAKFLPTSELLAKLIGDEDEEWDTTGPAGRSITPEWLRERLRNLLDPPGSTRESASGPRGYAFCQFKMPFERYLGTHPALDATILDTSYTSPDEPGSPGSPGDQDEKVSKIKDDFEPGVKKHPARPRKHPARSDSDDTEPGDKPGETPSEKHPAREKPKDSAKNCDEIPGEPGEPGRSAGGFLDTHTPDEDWSWTGSTVERPSAADPEKQPENRQDSPLPTARPRRATPNGPTPRSRPAPQLDMPEPSLIDYIEGSIADDIRQLRAANPNRSIKWLAKQSGQPPSVVREILGNGEGVQ